MSEAKIESLINNKNKSETVQWIDACTKLPDDEITVLVNHPSLDEPVWFGYYLGCQWYTAAGTPIDNYAVTHWADMPAGIIGN